MKIPVYLYAPNLIGYFRLITGIIAFIFVFDKPIYFFWIYGLSYIADGIDGPIARIYNQCSQFGMHLDMVTDRVCTFGLLLVLSHVNREYYFFYILLLMLDFATHWFQTSSCYIAGIESHKVVRNEDPLLFRIYYSSRPFLFFVCFCNEGYLLFTYLLEMIPLSETYYLISLYLKNYLFFPVFIFKQLVSICGMYKAIIIILESDESKKKTKTNKKE